MQITIFDTVSAQTAQAIHVTWQQLVDRCNTMPSYPTKKSCPLVKLAKFGGERTAAGALRHDKNVMAVWGLEADYDAEIVPAESAAVMLQFAGIEAFIYTSPSHTAAAPRWRVLAPLSRDHVPTDRRDLVARLNGALGGILAPESFTLSQAFYFGRVQGAAFETYQSTGHCIDLLPDLPIIYPVADSAVHVLKPVERREATPEMIANLRSALAAIPADDRVIWVGVGQALVGLGDTGFMLWAEWSAKSAKHDAANDWKQWATFAGERTGPAAVFAKAQALGWINPRQGADLSQVFASALPAIDWAVPTPLPNALPPVAAFQAELLPVALRPWVMDISHRMQCPADFSAVAALVGLSSLIGARAVVQPKARDDWQVVPNLWGAVVGRPGVKKSPALGEALKPLHRLESADFELWQAAHEAWALDCKVTAMQDDANERKAKGLAAKDPAAARALLQLMDTPAEPTARRYIVNDATVEKLGELMQQNAWGTLSYRDELYGLLTSLDKPGQEGARAFMLQSYDGNQGYTFDRIGRGTVYIPRVCLAMIGGIQPGRIQEYVRGAVAGGSADDGLLQRFGLTVWPDVTGDFVHVDQWPDTPAKQTAWAVFERLAQLQPSSDTSPAIWRFSPEAQALFVEWLVPFETEIRGDDLHPAMVSHLAKYRKLIPALALVFALIDTPDTGNQIGENELIRALAWGDYLRSHANRLYAAAVMPETAGAVSLLTKIKGGKLTDTDGVMLESFTPRQIAVKGWSGLNTPDAVRKAADLLGDYDWLRKEAVPSSDANGRGRPSERYLINPATLKGGAA